MRQYQHLWKQEKATSNIYKLISCENIFSLKTTKTDNKLLSGTHGLSTNEYLKQKTEVKILTLGYIPQSPAEFGPQYRFFLEKHKRIRLLLFILWKTTSSCLIL